MTLRKPEDRRQEVACGPLGAEVGKAIEFERATPSSHRVHWTSVAAASDHHAQRAIPNMFQQSHSSYRPRHVRRPDAPCPQRSRQAVTT
jgi:hypothetical protein